MFVLFTLRPGWSVLTAVRTQMRRTSAATHGFYRYSLPLRRGCGCALTSNLRFTVPLAGQSLFNRASAGVLQAPSH
ncbi:MAG: hypothetical protein K2O45_05725, partial [Oscillospiraceae bacterium]|nr:hypothetical protein [Oscillospiraceae bacterium]